MTPTIAVPIKNSTCYALPPCFDYLKERTGYAALEITITPSSMSKVRSFIRQLQSTEVRFHLSPRPEFDICAGQTAFEKVKQVIDSLAGMASPTFLTLHSFKPPDRESVEAVKELNKQSLRKGVVISLENLASGWTAEPEKLLDFAETTGVRLTVDIGHLNTSDQVRSGRYSRAEIIEMLGPFACSAHIYEHEENGHQAADDLFIMLDALQLLRLSPADWWVIELEDTEDFRKMFELIELVI